MLKQLFNEVKEEKTRIEKTTGEVSYPSLSIELFDAGRVYNLSREELKVLLQEAIYLLRDYKKHAEEDLMQLVEEWHPELFEEDEE